MSEKITITFPDENSKEVQKGISGLAIAEQISKSLAKEAIAFSINDEINDLSIKVEKDSRIKNNYVCDFNFYGKYGYIF